MKRPNFLFIMTDTQATNMVGCYSGKPLNTQNIDSLAAEGIRFNSAYTCSPVCTPARAGLFTGIYANQSGPWTNNVAPGKNISTMGRYFKDCNFAFFSGLIDAQFRAGSAQPKSPELTANYH